MKNQSRLQNSAINFVAGFGCRLLSLASAFIVRTVFIKCLGEEYLGINGLYSNILSMLSLADLGFGTAMVYSMYKPLACKDWDKLGQLMKLYRCIYTIVGAIILGLGLCIVPFLDYFIKNGPNIEGLVLYYLLFLFDTVCSYLFFAYRNAILQADQREYVISNYRGIFNLIKSAAQIIVLLVFRGYLVYLLTQIAITILQNVCLSVKISKEYPVFNRKTKKLPSEEVKRIFDDVKALTIAKFSHVILNSTDSIIISAFVGINWVGLISNFNLIIEAVAGILAQVTSAITASLGNYFATEDDNSGYIVFRRVEFLTFWLYAFSSVALITLLNPFVNLWLGEQFLLDDPLIVALVIRFFVAGFMSTFWTFRSTLGLFTQGKWRAVAVSVINIILSIGLSINFGATGIIIATPISRACVNLWYDPWIIHKYGFNKSVRPFFCNCLWKLLLWIITILIMVVVSKIIFSFGITILNFSLVTILTAIIPNAIFLLAFHWTEEFKYFLSLGKTVLNKLH